MNISNTLSMLICKGQQGSFFQLGQHLKRIMLVSIAHLKQLDETSYWKHQGDLKWQHTIFQKEL